jgi:hypothetical protein
MKVGMSVSAVATTGGTAATSGAVVAVATASVVVVAVALIAVQRRVSKRLVRTSNAGENDEVTDVDVEGTLTFFQADGPTHSAVTVTNPIFVEGDDK